MVKRTILSILLATLFVFVAGAQSPDPSTLPLVQLADLQYVGGFRVPDTPSAGSDLSYGGKPIAFNSAKKSLFIGSVWNRVAEITIPASLVNSTTPTAMPIAAYAQGFVDPTEGNMGGLSTSSTLLGAIYYDNGGALVSHFSRAHSLTQASFSGWSSVWRADRSGFVAGYMTDIPTEWQARLGGTALTGQCCLPIISRTSFGPAAFAFDPALVGQASVPAVPLLYYDILHPTLGPWDGSNTNFGATTTVTGVVIVPGTRSALFFGRNGLGAYCYGEGTADQALAESTIGFCYDPTNSSKGQHGYPYRYQVWAYDLNDFAAVKAGTKQPWDVLPYGVWPLELPLPNRDALGGTTFDPATKTIYVSQQGAQIIGCCGVMPVIHGFKVAAPTPVPTPTPSPTVAELEQKLADIKASAEAALAKIATLKNKPASYIMTALKKAAGQ
jgi:hypothetical protein